MQLSWSGQGTSWYVWLFWSNTFNLIDTFSIGQAYANQTDLVHEAHTDSTHLVLPQTNIDEIKVYRCNPNCNWVYWDSAISTGVYNNLPYHSHFTIQYTWWYSHSH
jgi:hypothetical protein